MNSESSARRLRAWERFFATGEIDVGTVRPEIGSSWRRCREAGLDPRAPKSPVVWNAEELAARHHRNNAFFDEAVPIMHFLRSAVRETGFILVLTDHTGVVLESYGSPTVMARAKQNNYVPGCCRDEKAVGTNAIGLAMIERRPIQLTGAEHFNVRHHSWTCSSAPVFSPTAELLGTVTLSGESSDAHPHTLGMVIAAAEAIQHRLRERTSEAERSKNEKLIFALLKSVTDAIVTVDSSGRIAHVNRVAETLLRTSERKLLSRPLTDVFAVPNTVDVFAERSGASPFEMAYDVDGHRTYFIAKPISMSENKVSLGAILVLSPRREFLKNVRGAAGLSARYTFADIVGRHPSMARAIELAEIVSKQNSRILISGETGTGKELLVQGIHNASDRASGPFVALNCAALPHDLIEAELFGYQEGAFTGSRRGGQVGKLELADGGTLFLDEISQMPYDMQAKLLRVLQDGLVTRLGDTKSVRVDVRIIAASNEDLFEKAQSKAFRLDLYFRLSVVEIKLPPLRERGDDLVLLSRVILERLCQRMGRPVLQLSPEAESMLFAHPWPGNVRELENVLEMAAIICETDTIQPRDLSSRLSDRHYKAASVDPTIEPLRKNGSETPGQGVVPMRDLEANVIRNAMQEYSGNVSQVSRRLGISRSTIYRKMREFGMNREIRIS